MGIADERLVSPGAVPQALRCAICTEVFSDPVCGAGECQHVFCRPCVTEALARKRECPMCRSRMNPHKLRISQPMQSVLDEIPVRCAHHTLGCFWSGRLDGSRAHETACLVPELQRAKSQIQELQVAKDLIAELKLENQSLERSLQRKTAELFDAKVKLSELPRLKEEKDQVSQENRKLKGEAQEFRAQIADIAGLLQQMTQPARTAGGNSSMGTVQVFLRDHRGKTQVVRISRCSDVSEINRVVSEKTGVSDTLFYLTCSGRLLQTNPKDIAPDSTIQMRMRAPLPHSRSPRRAN
ncbi:unnamed protein product [Effrenium voratum]|uniref:RING-type domain-containing protein n=1 Tax=Effrenium voratum TaxID=2562239 RepID=A0AA36MNU6_9DINO|nr:unnamed protein product [Effrenium voratum]